MNSQIFHPFVLPFVLGMAFVLTYCVRADVLCCGAFTRHRPAAERRQKEVLALLGDAKDGMGKRP